MSCELRCDFATDTAAPSYVCEGSHGERVVFGVSVVVRPEDIPKTACARFREQLLAIFGAGGPRRLDETVHELRPVEFWPHDADAAGARRRVRMPPAPPEPQDGIGFQGDLGRLPRSTVQDPEQLAAFERMRRGGG